MRFLDPQLFRVQQIFFTYSTLIISRVYAEYHKLSIVMIF